MPRRHRSTVQLYSSTFFLYRSLSLSLTGSLYLEEGELVIVRITDPQKYNLTRNHVAGPQVRNNKRQCCARCGHRVPVPVNLGRWRYKAFL